MTRKLCRTITCLHHGGFARTEARARISTSAEGSRLDGERIAHWLTGSLAH
ncbi:hypothetical protein [Paraburkholderia tagetis]|uniref:Uncharacterized protein n=1 Tax=Paraburkholderia tagetis TaxID=2913261 RepID=A0A9X1RFR4_9BURK|nr:hypothetical protein [Paraburkholderia tagetis]MCG5072046.1 hypothetical protein [Paraburkholderia tagetis]